MYDYPNAVTNEQYQTLVMQGLGVKNGVIPCAEVQFYSETGPNWYGNNVPPVSLGSAQALTSSHVLFMFREPIEGYTSRDMGGTSIDIGGVAVYNDGQVHLAPVDPQGNILTQYAGPVMSFPDYCTDASSVSLYLVMSYQSQSGGHVPALAFGGPVDPIAYPLQYVKAKYTYSLCYFGIPSGSDGNDILGEGLGSQEWNSDKQTDDNGQEGGGGGYPAVDRQVDYPSNPSEGAIATGLVTMYRPSLAELQALAVKLWSNDFITTIFKNWADPMQNIISIHQLPIDSREINVQAADIMIGNFDSEITSHKVLTASQWIDLDLGKINIGMYYKNFTSFDCDMEIWLPYVGFRSIDCKDCMDGQLWIRYKIDLFSGEFVARVDASSSFTINYAVDGSRTHPILQESGNMATQIPLSASNFMNVYTSIIAFGAAVANKDIMGAASAAMGAKPSYTNKGANNAANSGLMSVCYPYVVIRWTRYKNPDTFNAEEGIISNISGTLGNDLGFVSVVPGSLDLKNIPCLQEEREMIIDLLESGIIVQQI